VATASTPSADAHGTSAGHGTHGPGESPSGEHAESPLHERSGIELRGLIRFVIIFVVVAVVVHLLVWWLFVSFRAAVAQERQITGVNEQRIAPPEPRLQPSVQHNALPQADLGELHQRELAEFARRGWVDEKSGEVRVPDEIVAKVAAMAPGKK
jgi:hypothetical protein